MATITVRVPGKVILSGEHSVVYGHPAIVMALNRGITIEARFDASKLHSHFFQKLLPRLRSESVFDIINSLNSPESGITLKIESTLPIGCGMGSSAALSAGVVAIVLQLAEGEINKERVNEFAYELEKQIHYNPSGVDNSIVIYGGCLCFQKLSETEKKISPLPVEVPLPQFLIINTGKPEESTGEMVELVRKKNKSGTLNSVLKAMGDISNEMLAYLRGRTNATFSEILHKNEQLLEQLGVVSDSSQNVIRAIEQIGGAAKISGAGGATGASGIIIAYHDDVAALRKLLQSVGVEYFSAESNSMGMEVQYEE